MSTQQRPGARLLAVSLALAVVFCGRLTALFPQEVEVPGAEVLVVAEEWDPALHRAADRLIEYVEAVTGAVPGKGEVGSAERSGWVFLLLQRSLPLLREDGFELEVDPARRRVWIRSPSAPGIAQGIHELIRRMRQEANALFLSPVSLRRNPWVKNRELFIAEIEWHPTDSEKKVLDQLQKEFSWLNWPVERLHRYIEMLEAMGYNSVMLSDSDQMRWYAGESTEAAEGVNKVQSMLEYARSRGMGTTFFIWGQRGVEGLVENPRAPDQLADIMEYQNLMIDRYAPLADKWILHWADPGGCSLRGCTINTPQVISNRFFRRLRGRGYETDVSFSLWALRWGGWPGYTDWSSVVESGILDPGMGINMMRSYRADIAAAVSSQYRQTGVWGWYSNDMETNPGLHVHAEIQEKEFSRVHNSADRLLDWYSLEDNNHILNLPGLFVGARMLWDRSLSGAQALQEFCRAVWDPETAARVFEALRAIEAARCGPGVYMIKRDLWPHDSMPWVGRGSEDPGQDLERAEKALAGLESAVPDPAYVPKIPLIADPAELLRQIGFHLRYVRDYAAIRVGYEQALQQAHRGKLEEARDRMARLPELADWIPGSYGAVEYQPYLLLRDFARSWTGRSFSDNLALGRPVTASSWFKGDLRYAPGQAVNGILCEFQEEGWVADSSEPSWIKIDLGAVRPVTTVRVYNRAYERERWDNQLIGTPTSLDVFFAEQDEFPSRGTKTGEEPGYRLLGSVREWAASPDPGEYREVSADGVIEARFIKVLIHAAAGGLAVGTGEIEVR